MDQLTRRITDAWRELSLARRILLIGLGGTLLGVGYVLYAWSNSTAYVTLYAGLDPADSGQIVDQLRSRGTPFEVSTSGASVRVPEDVVDELRLDFAAQGLPAGSNTGFELFDGSMFAATDFVQRLNFQRGLQGELSRTIEAFAAVEDARVHIVLPERSLFVDDRRQATASVVLKLRGGMRLSASEVGGIARLVAGGVEGLEQESVTIIDTSGAVLFDGSNLEDGGVAGPDSQLQTQHAFEEALERDVQQMLDLALGPRRATVTVRATLDFDHLETETESYITGEEDGVPRSATTVNESYATRNGEVVGAVPGAVANIPGADLSLPTATLNEDTTTSYVRTETTTNFEVGRTVTRSVDAGGDVQSLSVSLLLDESIPTEQVTALTASVAAAVGIDTERGDVIAASQLAFDRTAIEEAEAAFASEASMAQILSYVRMGLPVLALVIGYIFFRMLMRSVGGRSYRVIEQPQAALAGGGAAAAIEAAAAQRQRSLAPIPEAEDPRSDVEERVTTLATQQPGAVAEVVQSWLKED